MLRMCFNSMNETSFTIQIKICAEYRDMLPRPRMVCQQPGRRPVGRSPGVPGKSNRGLCSMSRYSAQILICFISYIVQFLFLCGFSWELAGMPVRTVPSAIVHCNQNEALSSDNQSFQHDLLRCSWPIKTLSGTYVTDWWNWQIKWMKYVSMGSFQHKNQVNLDWFQQCWN